MATHLHVRHDELAKLREGALKVIHAFIGARESRIGGFLVPVLPRVHVANDRFESLLQLDDRLLLRHKLTVLSDLSVRHHRYTIFESLDFPAELHHVDLDVVDIHLDRPDFLLQLLRARFDIRRCFTL